MPAVKELKSKSVEFAQILISFGLFGLILGLPGGTKGFGAIVGSVKGE